MNQVVEELKETIGRKAERFTLLDQVLMYEELIDWMDERKCDALKEEYGVSGWDDEE